MRTRQGVAVPASDQSTSPATKKPVASEYLAEVRAMQSAQRAGVPVEPQAKPRTLTPCEIYPPVYTLEGRLTHANECTACFGRRDWRCRRCLELLRGAAPRSASYTAPTSDRQRRLF